MRSRFRDYRGGDRPGRVGAGCVARWDDLGAIPHPMHRGRHAVSVPFDGGAVTQTTVQLTVSPMVYAIALRPDDPGQVQAAVSLACGRWGGIGFPWLPLAGNGTVTDGAEKLCDVLDVAGIIDLTRSDAREPIPAGIGSLGLPVGTVGSWPQLGLPVRGVVPPQPDVHLVSAGEIDGGGVDPVALLGLGYLDPDERSAWDAAGQDVRMAVAEGSLFPQLDDRTAVGVTAGSVDDFVGTSMFGISTALVWLVPDSFTLPEVARDLSGFWNYRALRLRHRGTVTILARLSSLREGGAGAQARGGGFGYCAVYADVRVQRLGCGR